MFLKGISNWGSYKSAITLQLESIGYEVGTELIMLDELKIAALIQRASEAEVSAIVDGMKVGTAILDLYESIYQQSGEIQEDALYSNLSDLRYEGGCPILFVSKLKSLVRDYQSAGGKLGPRQLTSIFKNAVKTKARRWHKLMLTAARFQP